MPVWRWALLVGILSLSAFAEPNQVIPNAADRLRGQEQLQQQLRNQSDPNSAEGTGVNAKILREQERKAARHSRIRRKPKPQQVIVN